jgi:23S rRNA pseudouridine1911/1915/1917 synthase
MKKSLTITDDDGVVRVDKYLADTFSEYSRSAIAKLFTLNLIKYKGEPIQPGHKLRPGATFEYDLTPLSEKPEVIALPILYEDDNVIVVNKPAGIISHARGRFWQEASVASFIRDRISGMDGERGGIVHRLDRATSGVMICAKNEETLKFLQKQFSDRKVEKTYVAVIKGTLSPEEAIIDAPIARNAKEPKKFRVDMQGKSAQTHYKVLETNNGYSLVELRPKTGRTHQLRIHLLHVGHPIVGDELYGGEKSSRLLLHAKELGIHTSPNEVKTFSAPLPDEIIQYDAIK